MTHPTGCICVLCVAPADKPGEKPCAKARWCVCKPDHAGPCRKLRWLLARGVFEIGATMLGESVVRTS